MRKNLFEIGGELERTLEELEKYCIENQTDELPDELIDRLNINQDELDGKLNAYYHVVAQIEAEKNALKEYKQSILDKVKAKEKALDNNIERLKGLMVIAVDKFGEERKNGNKFYKLSTCSINLTKSKKVVIIDEDVIPSEYKKSTTTYSISKTEIGKALKGGEEVKGAELKESEFKISFR